MAAAETPKRLLRAGVATPCIVLLAALLVVALAMPRAAHANGDPASDVLLLQDAFYPYAPEVPESVKKGLDDTLKLLREKGFPLKVAIIASQNDLGSVPQFFGRAAPYAVFLEREIAFDKAKPLLIVMPTGYATDAVGPKADAALADLDKPDAESGDSLGRAAIKATVALAKAQGKPVPEPKLPPAAEEGGGTSPVVFLVPVLLLALGGGLAAIRARQLGDTDDAAET